MSEAAAETLPWYEEWFNSEAYELVYKRRDDAEAERTVDLMERLLQPQPGAKILDVACGRGRHALAMARRGYQVVGVDLSENAIRKAKRAARTSGLMARFMQGDMREVVEPEVFDVVTNLFTAFGYFDDPAENQKAINAMAAALKPGGKLMQDYLNAPFVASNLRAHDQLLSDGITVHQYRRIEEGRVKKQIVLEYGGQTHEYEESVALYTPDDLASLYEAAGLEVLAVYGDYDGSPYYTISPRAILTARKP